MITAYKGHEITVTRERSMGGWTQIYYGVFRESDGYECTSGFCDTSDSTRTFTRILKDRVDAELADADPWGEIAKGHKRAAKAASHDTKHAALTSVHTCMTREK